MSGNDTYEFPSSVSEFLGEFLELPLGLLLLFAGALLVSGGLSGFLALHVIAPTPRKPRRSEKKYITVLQDGTTSDPEPLPCWYDEHMAMRTLARTQKITPKEAQLIEPAEVCMTVVVPAFNEEERLSGMLEETIEYLVKAYASDAKAAKAGDKSASSNGSLQHSESAPKGWEILVISDGSTDKTVEIALSFARSHQSSNPPTPAGPWSPKKGSVKAVSTSIPPGSIRVIKLEQNRGKGGAVTHGMRHARGEYVVFADADGASRFSDLGRLVEGCEKVADRRGRAVGIGSRAHLVGSEAVVKRSFLRNTLMHSFHLLLRLLTPPATSAIKDTQCGFKLFTRASLPYIIPYMHSEGWIFDVEMLMLAESANIPMAEVAIGWKEVKGSKLNVVWDSLGMAWSLAVLRIAWTLNVYKKDI